MASGKGNANGVKSQNTLTGEPIHGGAEQDHTETLLENNQAPEEPGAARSEKQVHSGTRRAGGGEPKRPRAGSRSETWETRQARSTHPPPPRDGTEWASHQIQPPSPAFRPSATLCASMRSHTDIGYGGK